MSGQLANRRAARTPLDHLKHDLRALRGHQVRPDAVHQEMRARIRLPQADLHLDRVPPE